MTKRTVIRVTVSGIVTKAELRRYDGPCKPTWMTPGSEYYHYKACIAVETDDGRSYWFYSPPAQMSVSCPVGSPIAIVRIGSNEWIAEENSKANVAAVGKPNANKAVLRHQVGDRITITGRVKRETRYGPQLFYVQLVHEEA